MQNLSQTCTSPPYGHGHQLPADYTIGALFRDYGEEYIRIYRPDLRTIKLIRSIRVCQTPVLGGKRYTCKGCGLQRYQYFSCGNSQCPQCQGIKRLQWQDRLSVRMLNVPYSHTTFTLPSELRGLSRLYPKEIFNLLFRSSWETIRIVCKKEKNVGALPGMTSVLHTWGSDLKYHIHVHCLVTFGGLTKGETLEWQWPKQKLKLSRFGEIKSTYRRIFLKGLKKLMATKEVIYHQSYESLAVELMKKNWVVSHLPPTAETKVIEEYLGRYICRIGISNHRLFYDKAGKNVRIEYNDYRNQKKGQAAPKKYLLLPPLIAMEKFLQHQLPAYFQKVRHYGLHSGVIYKKIKDKIPAELKRNGKTVRTVLQILKSLLSIQPYKCESCGAADFEIDLIKTGCSVFLSFILHKPRAPPYPTAVAENKIQ